MLRLTLFLLAGYFSLSGALIFAFPVQFYEMTPGLAEMGPYNLHFIKDVSFAFLASGAGLFYGSHHQKRDLACLAAAWPFMHALFHLQIWGHRGFPFDLIWLSDFLGVVLPGLLAIALAMKMKPDHLSVQQNGASSSAS
ncbi:MAG: hypothetical protein ABJ242_00620 [Marinomonas sp.]